MTHACEPQGQPSVGENRTRCRTEGRLVLLQGDTITLAKADATASYDLSMLSRVEVSRGLRSHWLTGAAAGFLVGWGVTFALLATGGSTSPCDQAANQDAVSTGECVGVAALGGLAGAGIGAILGGLFHSERWREVPLDRLRLGLTPPDGRGFGLALVVAF